MTTRVRCATCLREEVWTADHHDVLQQGGVRKPAIPAMLAAWDSLLAARREGRFARDTCICGQPLIDTGEVDDEAHAIMSWTLALPDGRTFSVARELAGPDGPVDEDTLTAVMEAAYPRRFRERPHILAFQAMTLTPVVVAIFMLWAMSATSLFLFLRAFASVDAP